MQQTKESQVIDQVRQTGVALPQTVIFGDGTVAHLPALLQGLFPSSRLFLVLGSAHSRRSGLDARLTTMLADAGLQPAGEFHVDCEPSVHQVDEASRLCRGTGAGVVVAAGGGSVIDCAKAVAAMATNPGSVRDYLEGVGHSQINSPPLPVFALPTTAGTGSEATRNAVISVPGLAIKRSLRHPGLLPRAAIVDPELTWSSPPEVTARTGTDALTQLFEPCISVKRKQEVTRIALVGLTGIREALPVCFRKPAARPERRAMSLAALLSGVCLANAGLGLAHGIASGLGALKDVPHGLICGILLPHVLRYNRAAVEAELELACSAFLNRPANSSTVDEGIQAVEDLNQTLGIPPDLRSLNLTERELVEIAERSMGGSMSANPIPMTVDSVASFLRTVSRAEVC